MNEVQTKKIEGYCNAAGKGAVVGVASSIPLVIREILNFKEYSKKIPYPDFVDKFENTTSVAISFNQEQALAMKKIFDAQVMCNKAIKESYDAINTLRGSIAKQSKNTLDSMPKIVLVLAGLFAGVGVIIHYFKNKLNLNKLDKADKTDKANQTQITKQSNSVK